MILAVMFFIHPPKYEKERDQWEDQDVGGWTILKLILER
jgi:hypothetical protein